jgi:hypothetical protein
MIEMHKFSYKVLAVLLLAAMATVVVAGQEGPLMVVAARPAGCHQHGAKPPVSAPVSYRCCQSGHDSAILQTLLTPQLSGFSTSVSIPVPIPVATQRCLHSLMISSSDPPDTIPLRV